jgi:acyl-coenzyme A synthetase/AMP-(fatty) acid ligase
VIVLLHSEHLHKYDLSSLRTLCSAAAPLGEELSKAFEARLPNCKM